MFEIKKKVGIIVGEILCNASKVDYISKPTFREDYVTFATHYGGRNELIEIPYSDLLKLHTYKLDRYVCQLIKQYHLG